MRLPPISATISISRFICSTPLARFPSSSTIQGAKPMALSTVSPLSAIFLPSSLSEPPPLTWASSSRIQGSIPWKPAFAAMSTTSEIGSFWPMRVLVLRQYLKGSSAGRPEGAPAAALPVETAAAANAPAERRASRRDRIPFICESPLEGQAAYYFYTVRPRKSDSADGRSLLPGRRDLIALVALQDLPVRRVVEHLRARGQVGPERPGSRIPQVDLEVVRQLGREDVVRVGLGIPDRAHVLLEAVGLRLLHHLDHVGVRPAQDALALGVQLRDLPLDLGHGDLLVAADRRHLALGRRLDVCDHLLRVGADFEDALLDLGLQLLQLVHHDLGLPLLVLGELLLRGDLRVLDGFAQFDRDVDVADQPQEDVDVAQLRLVDQRVRERLLEQLAGAALDEVLRAVLRSFDAADGLDLRPDDLADDVLGRAVAVHDDGHVLRREAPDDRDVQLDREAVLGRKGDLLQRDLVVADPDLVDLPLVGIPVVDPGLEDVLLDSALPRFRELAFGRRGAGEPRDAAHAAGPDAGRGHGVDLVGERIQAILAGRQDPAHDALLTVLGKEVPGLQLVPRHRFHDAHLVGLDLHDGRARVHVILQRAEKVPAFPEDLGLDALHALLHDAVAVGVGVLRAQLVGEDEDLSGLDVDAADGPAPEPDVEEEKDRHEGDDRFDFRIHSRSPTSSRPSSSPGRAG